MPADTRLGRGEYDRAIADYDKAIGLDSNDAEFYDKRAQAHYTKGDYDRAIADATRAIELDPTNATAFNCRSSSFNFKGDYERAIADATRAIELSPNSGSDFNNRGFAYLEKGEFSLAIRDLTRAVELIPQSANPYRHRGVAYLKTGKIDLARADLTRALELKPDYQDAKTALAELEQAEVSAKATPSSHVATDQVASEIKAALAAPLPKALPSAFPSGKRVALVIGNSNYSSVARLANPANDAKLMANALKSLGFELIGGGAQLDLDKAGFDAAVQSFGNQLQGAGCRSLLLCRPRSWAARYKLPRPGQRQPDPRGRYRLPNGGCRGCAPPDGSIRHEAQRRDARCLPQQPLRRQRPQGRQRWPRADAGPGRHAHFLCDPAQTVSRKTAPTVTAPIAGRLPRPSARRASTSSSPSIRSVSW